MSIDINRLKITTTKRYIVGHTSSVFLIYLINKVSVALSNQQSLKITLLKYRRHLWICPWDRGHTN